MEAITVSMCVSLILVVLIFIACVLFVAQKIDDRFGIDLVLIILITAIVCILIKGAYGWFLYLF